MARTKTSATASASPAAPVVDTPVVAAAATEKPKNTKKSVKAETPVVETPVVAATPAPVAVETPVEEDVKSPFCLQRSEFAAKLTQMAAIASALKTEFRALDKAYERELKTVQKTSSKRKRKTGNRAPSGFVKPTKISDELATFLGKDKGTEMARTEVTREINKYIRSNNLQDAENRRKIIPDAKLKSLLKLSAKDELTYFNLQKYMSPHFAKPVAATTTA
jgi:chromatin remodeling complex protein RSC6